MSSVSESDALLVRRIRAGEPQAWEELIARFEGRLLAFVEARLHRRAASEDVVQETLIGFLTSLPNFDAQRPLEGYLFSIAAHKLTDYLRREGRRPAVPLAPSDSQTDDRDIPGPLRAASSLVRSDERRHIEESVLARALAATLDYWRSRGDYEKLCCAELLFVRGMPNKEAAAALGLSEQAVANYKFDFLARLKAALRKQDLPAEIFPELAAEHERRERT